MSTKLTISCLVATLFVAGPAVAQTSPAPVENQPAADRAAPSRTTAEPSGGQFLAERSVNLMRGSKLIGAAVIGSDHTKVGDINEVLVDSDGKIQAVVIGVGGILGLGEKNVAVPFESLLWNFGDAARTPAPADMDSMARGAPAGPPGTTGPASPDATAAASASDPDVRTTGTVNRTAMEMAGEAGRDGATAIMTDKDGAPRSAFLRMSRADLQNAPAFEYRRSNPSETDSGPARPANPDAGYGVSPGNAPRQ